jgi:O-antigen/teichoic acid export membrane protein
MSDPTQPSEATSRAEWRDQRAEMSDDTRGHRDAMRDNWPGIPIAGAIVIAVGVIFLLGNFGLHLPPRWWAIFILVPAAGALVTATRFFRADGGFSSRAAGATTSGALMLAVALILFLNLSWGAYWPVLVIIVGLGILVRGYRRRN